MKVPSWNIYLVYSWNSSHLSIQLILLSPSSGHASMKSELLVPWLSSPLLHQLILESLSPLSKVEQTRIPSSMSFKSRNRAPLSHGFNSTLLLQLLQTGLTSPKNKMHSSPGLPKFLCLLPLLLPPLLALPLAMFGTGSGTAFRTTNLLMKISTSIPGNVIFRRWLAGTILTTSSTFPTCQVLMRNLLCWKNKRS